MTYKVIKKFVCDLCKNDASEDAVIGFGDERQRCKTKEAKTHLCKDCIEAVTAIGNCHLRVYGDAKREFLENLYYLFSTYKGEIGVTTEREIVFRVGSFTCALLTDTVTASDLSDFVDRLYKEKPRFLERWRENSEKCKPKEIGVKLAAKMEFEEGKTDA